MNTPMEQTLRLLEEHKDNSEPILVENCIVCAIREVQEDGSDVLIGHIDIIRCPEMHHSKEGRGQPDDVVKALQERNATLPLGDPDILWAVGCMSL